MPHMKTITVSDIRSWRPCYDPTVHLDEAWRGTIVDILKIPTIPPQDRVWCAFRSGQLHNRDLRLFAVWCAREAMKKVKKPDPRSVAACNVAERFANGEATNEELTTAGSEAWYAVMATSGYPSEYWPKYAHRAASWSAAKSSASFAAMRAAEYMLKSALASATESLTRSAERTSQLEKLIELFEKGDR